MRRSYLGWAALFAGDALAGAGCGGDNHSGMTSHASGPGLSSGGVAATTADVTGVRDGSYSWPTIPATPISIDLQQSGAAVTGTYSASSGATGTVAGRVRGSVVDFTLTSTMASADAPSNLLHDWAVATF